MRNKKVHSGNFFPEARGKVFTEEMILVKLFINLK
jgi:hypothetical protein